MNKPFTEMEIPKRTTEFVIVVKEIDILEDFTDGNCTQMVGQLHLTSQFCGLSASWQCVICNQWTCDLHEDKSQFTPPDSTISYSVCENCGKLPKYEQKQIYEFQIDMNDR